MEAESGLTYPKFFKRGALMFELKNIVYKDILEIEELKILGERITCIVGPSGAGKSTLLRLLNNLINPDRGEISYLGQPLMKKDPIKLRREVMMLGQNTVIFPASIEDNLLKIFKLLERKPPQRKNLEQILEFVQLDKPLETKADRLSGGEKQRLALARLLLLDPAVLLLDEPSSDLDDKTEEVIVNGLVKYVSVNNKTMIMITHSKKIAKNYGDDIITINNGGVSDIIRGV